MIPLRLDEAKQKGDVGAEALYYTFADNEHMDHVIFPDNGPNVFTQLAEQRRLGRRADVLVIAGHGALRREKVGPGKWVARGFPRIVLREGGLITKTIDVAGKRNEMKTLVEKIESGDDEGSRAKKKLAELRRELVALRAASHLMKPGARVHMLNCQALSSPAGRAFIEDIGRLMLGRHGGTIRATDNFVQVAAGPGTRGSLVASGCYAQDPANPLDEDGKPNWTSGRLDDSGECVPLAEGEMALGRFENIHIAEGTLPQGLDLSFPAVRRPDPKPVERDYEPPDIPTPPLSSKHPDWNKPHRFQVKGGVGTRILIDESWLPTSALAGLRPMIIFPYVDWSVMAHPFSIGFDLAASYTWASASTPDRGSYDAVGFDFATGLTFAYFPPTQRLRFVAGFGANLAVETVSGDEDDRPPLTFKGLVVAGVGPCARAGVEIRLGVFSIGSGMRSRWLAVISDDSAPIHAHEMYGTLGSRF